MSHTDATTGEHANPPLVALLEDDRVLCLSLEIMFEQAGLPLVIGSSVDELIEALVEADGPPDVLVSDYYLAADGTAPVAVSRVLERLGRDIPVIITTGDGTASTRAEIHGRGWRFVEKPYEPDALRAVIADVLTPPAA